MAALFLVLAAGCVRQADKVSRVVDGFLPMEARAFQLRQDRFALADSIRFATERLLAADSTSAEHARIEQDLAAMQTQKEELVRRSLTLADSVKVALDAIMSRELTTDVEKKAFEDTLNARLRGLGFVVSQGMPDPMSHPGD